MSQLAKFVNEYDFLIPTGAYVDAVSYLDTVKKKFDKANSDSFFSYKTIGEEYRPVYSKENNRYYPLGYRRIRLSIRIGTPEWQFRGFLTKSDNGENKCTGIDGNNIVCPPFFRHSEFECDCCKNKGSRKYLFIIQNRSSGWLKKIGYECLNDYTHSKMLSEFKAAEKAVEELRNFEKVPNRNDYERYPIRMILRLSVQLVDKYGYVKEGEKDTKSIINELVTASSERASALASEYGIISPYERCTDEIDKKVDYIWKRNSDLLETYKNSYEKTIHETLNKYKTVPSNKIGLIASIYRKKPQ